MKIVVEIKESVVYTWSQVVEVPDDTDVKELNALSNQLKDQVSTNQMTPSTISKLGVWYEEDKEVPVQLRGELTERVTGWHYPSHPVWKLTEVQP